MFPGRAALLMLVVTATACSNSVPSLGGEALQSPAEAASAATDEASTDPSSATGDGTSDSTDGTDATTGSEAQSSVGSSVEPETTTVATTAATSTTAATTTTAPSTTTTTTTTVPPLDVYDPSCVRRVEPGQGLLEIIDEFDDDSVDLQTVMAENGLETDVLEPAQLLDVCVDNGLNDIDGATRGARNSALVAREVKAQQTKLNEIFAGYGIRELLVDGISGPVTRQRLCAFRLAAGLPVTLTDMEAGSDEEQMLMAAETLPIPFTSSILSERWALIDLTCQIMFVGVGTERLQFVFPTSTGEAGFETRPQNRSDVFKFNPASDNAGWHDSTTYPSAEDNPLNGNMYKPLYFDGGLAIHGANNVPRSPASKGCARLRVENMDLLLDWLGLSGDSNITYDERRINLTVNVQGTYSG